MPEPLQSKPPKSQKDRALVPDQDVRFAGQLKKYLEVDEAGELDKAAREFAGQIVAVDASPDMTDAAVDLLIENLKNDPNKAFKLAIYVLTIGFDDDEREDKRLANKLRLYLAEIVTQQVKTTLSYEDICWVEQLVSRFRKNQNIASPPPITPLIQRLPFIGQEWIPGDTYLGVNDMAKIESVLSTRTNDDNLEQKSRQLIKSILDELRSFTAYKRVKTPA